MMIDTKDLLQAVGELRRSQGDRPLTMDDLQTLLKYAESIANYNNTKRKAPYQVMDEIKAWIMRGEMYFDHLGKLERERIDRERQHQIDLDLSLNKSFERQNF